MSTLSTMQNHLKKLFFDQAIHEQLYFWDLAAVYFLRSPLENFPLY
ncbi:hypothetical protein KP78_07410 [Jeotgalibacillus soli]|uniref:Uncharacterized protein n=1 Tax=Jeotgalibacillus soli TaxID=889306 RepID=A0A0C2VZ87_9BACL|nr:hypothetical protein KP78_07410 [Jeotgalibacillus soli]